MDLSSSASSDVPPFDKDIAEKIHSSDDQDRLTAIKYISSYLENAENGDKALTAVINAGYYDVLVALVKGYRDVSTELLYEALVTLVLFTAGDDASHCEMICNDLKLIETLHEILNRTYEEEWNYKMKFQVLCAFGDVVGKSVKHRDLLVDSYRFYDTILLELAQLRNDISTITNYIKDRKSLFADGKDRAKLPKPIQYAFDKLNYLRNLVWAIRNIYDHEPKPVRHLESGDGLLELLMLYYSLVEDLDVLREISALFMVMAHDSHDITSKVDILPFFIKLLIRMKEILFERKFVQTAAEVLESQEVIEVLDPILKFIAVLASENDDFCELVTTDRYLRFQDIRNLIKLFPHPALQEDGLLIFGNGLIGSPLSQHMMMDSGFYVEVIEFLFTTTDEAVREQCIWALSVLLDEDDELVLDTAQMDFGTMTTAVRDLSIALTMRLIQSLYGIGYGQLASKCVYTLFRLERKVQVFNL